MFLAGGNKGQAKRTIYPRRGAAERALIESGAVIDAWTEGPDLVVLAADPDRVDELLDEWTQGRVRVVESRWTRDQIRSAENSLGPSESLVSVGSEYTSDYQYRIVIEVRSVDADMQARIESIPADLLRVVVVR